MITNIAVEQKVAIPTSIDDFTKEYNTLLAGNPKGLPIVAPMSVEDALKAAQAKYPLPSSIYSKLTALTKQLDALHDLKNISDSGSGQDLMNRLLFMGKGDFDNLMLNFLKMDNLIKTTAAAQKIAVPTNTDDFTKEYNTLLAGNLGATPAVEPMSAGEALKAAQAKYPLPSSIYLKLITLTLQLDAAHNVGKPDQNIMNQALFSTKAIIYPLSIQDSDMYEYLLLQSYGSIDNEGNINVNNGFQNINKLATIYPYSHDGEEAMTMDDLVNMPEATMGQSYLNLLADYGDSNNVFLVVMCVYIQYADQCEKRLDDSMDTLEAQEAQYEALEKQIQTSGLKQADKDKIQATLNVQTNKVSQATQDVNNKQKDYNTSNENLSSLISKMLDALTGVIKAI